MRTEIEKSLKIEALGQKRAVLAEIAFELLLCHIGHDKKPAAYLKQLSVRGSFYKPVYPKQRRERDAPQRIDIVAHKADIIALERGEADREAGQRNGIGTME